MVIVDVKQTIPIIPQSLGIDLQMYEKVMDLCMEIGTKTVDEQKKIENLEKCIMSDLRVGLKHLLGFDYEEKFGSFDERAQLCLQIKTFLGPVFYQDFVNFWFIKFYQSLSGTGVATDVIIEKTKEVLTPLILYAPEEIEIML